MTKDRPLDELVAIFTSLSSEEDRFHFINDQCSVREIFRLDQAGYLKWTPITDNQ